MTDAAVPSPAIDPATLAIALRERTGANKADDSFAPVEPFEVDAPGGLKAWVAPAWYDLIGDLQLRLVRQESEYVYTLHMVEQLDELKLTIDEAVSLALANLRRLHGEPMAAPWHNLQRVSGRDEDVSSAYFLDRAFWRQQLAEHPDGLVVAVPRTDALLFAPLADSAAIDSMRQGVPGLHAGGGENYRLSSALYLFKDDRWTVFQPAAPAP